MRLNAATAAGSFRLSVMLRLLRCRFWKSDPSRGPPSGSPAPGSGGNSILITLAPQSASWRTQVGPARTRVKSRTVKRSSAREPLGNGMFLALASDLVVRVSCRRRAGKARHSPISRLLSTEAGDLSRQGLITMFRRGLAVSVDARDD